MENKVILVTSDLFGTGDAELGETAMETFFTVLKQKEPLPHAIFLMNRGVFLATEQSYVSLHLKELQDKGVPILVCKTCADYYEMEQQMSSGVISSLKEFVDLSMKYEVLTIA